MKQTLYLECYTGVSGDMLAGALLDLGADETVLRQAIESLNISGFEMKINRVKKAGIDACDFDVRLDQVHENHDHDLEYLYGTGPEQVHKHEHGQEHRHEHRHGHTHGHGHTHEHRGLQEVLDIIGQAQLTDGARNMAVRIFEILAQAEAKAHGVSPQEVHFHEVGAVDAIVDVIAIAVCLDNLKIEEVIVPVLYEGSGHVRCQHGVIPVPVPAVQAIAGTHGLPLHITGRQGELVTPTGAAAIAAMRTGDRLPESFTIRKTGIGAGKRAYEIPSMVRAMLISENRDSEDCIYKLESNIDDCSGEVLGYVMDRLFARGAKDVHYTPVYMKKSRPAYQLNVICAKEDIPALETIIFSETTTIGIRRQKMKRTVLEREIKEVETDFGMAAVKVCSTKHGEYCYPEYSSVAELATKGGMSYMDMYQLIERKYHEQL